MTLFGKQVGQARNNYNEFIRDGGGLERRSDFMSGGLRSSNGGIWPRGQEIEMYHSRVLGSGEFVEAVLERTENLRKEKIKKIGLNELVRQIAKDRGIHEKELYQKTKRQKVSEGKAMLIYVGIEYLGKSNLEMANLTRMTGSPASRAKIRGEDLFKESKLGELVRA